MIASIERAFSCKTNMLRIGHLEGIDQQAFIFLKSQLKMILHLRTQVPSRASPIHLQLPLPPLSSVPSLRSGGQTLFGHLAPPWKDASKPNKLDPYPCLMIITAATGYKSRLIRAGAIEVRHSVPARGFLGAKKTLTFKPSLRMSRIVTSSSLSRPCLQKQKPINRHIYLN
jgi:hypothetical protein